MPMLAGNRGRPREVAAHPRRPRVPLQRTGSHRHWCGGRRRTFVTGTAHDQAARDDAHLQSLGIKPELKRSLGFLSNFAVAFSYISVSTGTFTVMGLALAVAGPIFFWAWPIVIIGQ